MDAAVNHVDEYGQLYQLLDSRRRPWSRRAVWLNPGEGVQLTPGAVVVLQTHRQDDGARYRFELMADVRNVGYVNYPFSLDRPLDLSHLCGLIIQPRAVHWTAWGSVWRLLVGVVATPSSLAEGLM